LETEPSHPPPVGPAEGHSISSGIPQPLVGMLDTDRVRIEELSDKLIEKREKLEYFLISASTAVLVFSFNDFNKNEGLLQAGPLWLTMVSWSLLLLSPGFGLLAIRRRHGQYAISQEWLRENRTKPRDAKEKSKIERGKLSIRAGDLLMSVCFVAGIGVLALSYSLALLSRP